MYILQLANTPEAVNRAQAMFADNPATATLFDNVLKQWKVIIMLTEPIFSEKAGLDSKDSSFMMKYMLQCLF